MSIASAVAEITTACNTWSLGYNQGDRLDYKNGGSVDCSSLVIIVCQNNGLLDGNNIAKGVGATYTGNMKTAFTARGWTALPGNTPVAQLQPGDVLLNEARHTAMYIGGGKVAEASIDERGKASGGDAGDQTGQETKIVPYFSEPWDVVLRYTAKPPAPILPTPTDPRPDSLTYSVTTMVLKPAQGIPSPDGKHRLVMQTDGNMVIYSSLTGKDVATWSSGTAGRGEYSKIQTDGNFVVYDKDGAAVWTANIAGMGANRLTMQNDGNLVAYRSDGAPVWASNTAGH